MQRTPISRRRFVQGVATVAGATFAGPYILRAAQPGRDRIRIAFIGTGGQGGAHLGLAEHECTCVAYTDADNSHWDRISKIAPKAKGYTDYRQMFDKHLNEIDAVCIAIPDHNHYLASMLAVTNGKACYTEKPLTWCVQEARQLGEATLKAKVATQMGNMGHANEGNRLIVEWVRGGVIGDVKEVHTWTNRPVWPQGITRGNNTPVPASLNWDAWIGPAPYREHHAHLHPFDWRGWFDFGCGAIGDMGCHTWDNVFWSMEPDYPETVELLAIEGSAKETFPRKSSLRWTFPAKGNRPGFIATWSAGGIKPAVPEEILNDPQRDNKTLPGSGNLYIGTKGKLLVSGDYGDSPRLIPESFHREAKKPEKSIPRSPGHKAEWLMAIRGERPFDYPGSNFGRYAAPLTEVMLLGSIALRMGNVGDKFSCDAVARTVTTESVKHFLSRQPRKGWSI